MKRASFLRVLLTLALGSSSTASAQPPAPSPSPTQARRGIELRADQELRKMSEFLAKLPRFALEAEETFDEVPDGQPKITLTNVRRIAVMRPNQMAADANGLANGLQTALVSLTLRSQTVHAAKVPR